MKNKKNLKIGEREINPENYLKTFTNLGTLNENFLNDYSELVTTITSLLGVCQGALLLSAQNETLEDREREQLYGFSSLHIAKVLELTKSLIPVPEMQLLTDIADLTNNIH
jgi:hypothetical protein